MRSLLVVAAFAVAEFGAGWASILSVPLPEAEVRRLLDAPSCRSRPINGPELCAVSGPDHAIAALEAVLEAAASTARRAAEDRGRRALSRCSTRSSTSSALACAR
jgi:acyl transferase domain-containing protein